MLLKMRCSFLFRQQSSLNGGGKVKVANDVVGVHAWWTLNLAQK
jgi:hypothetical protein